METNTAVTTHKQFTNGNVHQLKPPEDKHSTLWQVLEPWPNPVGPEIISDIESALQKHLFLSAEGALTCALWVAHADMFVEFECTPRLGITAPFKGSGKTKLLTVLELLTNHSVNGAVCTSAAFERLSAVERIAFFMDEADRRFFNPNDGMTTALNVGYDVGKQYIKVAVEGKDFKAVGQPIYSAVALAGISLPQRLADTTLDRTILIKMVKAKAGQIADKYRKRKHKDKFLELGSKLLRWVNDHRQETADYEPVFPDSVEDREVDKWLPLVAIAKVASPELGRKAMGLVFRSSNVSELTGDDEKKRFLKDVLAVYKFVKPNLQSTKHTGMSIKGIQPTQMAIELCNIHRHEDDDDRYWERYNAKKSSSYFKDEDMAIKPYQVTSLFADLEVSKKSIKHPDGTVMDGHRWDDMEPVCDQYLSLDSAEYVPGEDRAEDHGRQVGTYSSGMEVSYD